MAKKKKSKQKKSNNKSILYYINIFIIVLCVILLAYITTQFLFTQKDDVNQEINQIQNIQQIDTKTVHERFEEKTSALEIEYVDDETLDDTPVITKPKPTFKFDDDVKPKSKIVKKPEPKIIHEIIKPKPISIKKDTRPKLAIIIDDVTLQRQVNKITHLGYPVTMSFLPPTKIHKYSAKIAKPFDVYMIHLPMEAGSRRYEEANTLHIGDSLIKIDKRVKEVKKLYPKAVYLNNHTGSKFTSDYNSMDKLMRVLKKYNYIFVDSRTTAKTKAKINAKRYGVRYLSRNIFLDNKQDKYHITLQLKKAIKIAKKRGYAIAIGHPHSITLKTLKESKSLFKGLHLVYINSL